MKITAMIARYLLGLIFAVFGLNGFLQFLPAAPMPPLAGQYVGALFQSHYALAVFAIQIVCGLLFLMNLYVPLALTLIGPVIVNILLFHIFMAPAGLPLAGVVAVLWAIVFYRVRSAFAGILEPTGRVRL